MAGGAVDEGLTDELTRNGGSKGAPFFFNSPSRRTGQTASADPMKKFWHGVGGFGGINKHYYIYSYLCIPRKG